MIMIQQVYIISGTMVSKIRGPYTKLGMSRIPTNRMSISNRDAAINRRCHNSDSVHSPGSHGCLTPSGGR